MTATAPGGDFVLPDLTFPEAAPPAAPAVGTPAEPARRRAPRPPAAPKPRALSATDPLLRWAPVALIALAPLASGGVEAWAQAAIEVGACAVAAVWLVRLLLHPAACRDERSAASHLPGWSAGLHGPLLAVAAVGLLQIAPLGPLVAGLSPASAETYRIAGASAAARVSVAPAATLRALAALAALGLLFLAVLGTLRGRGEARHLAGAVVVVGFAHAIGAILWHFAAPGRAYGAAPAGGIAFGPYFNRNHFACLMGMAIPVGVGYLASLGSRPVAGPGAEGGAATARAGELRVRQALVGFAVAVMAGALGLTGSRAGIASTLVALAALALAAGPGRRTRGRLAAAGAACLAVAAFVAWLAGGTLAARLATLGDLGRDGSAAARVAIWGDTVRLAAEFPLLGAGYGAYGAALPRWQSAATGQAVEHAHGDWLQLLAEGGLAGGLAVAALVAAYARAAARLLRLRRDREPVLLGGGFLAGAGAFLVHAAADFNLHVPANALWLAVIAAAGLKAAASRA